jgi:hypothetical protein
MRDPFITIRFWKIRRKPPKENLAKRFPSRKDLDQVTKDTGSRCQCNTKMAGMERERRVSEVLSLPHAQTQHDSLHSEGSHQSKSCCCCTPP